MFEIFYEAPWFERLEKLIGDGGPVVGILLVLSVFTGTVIVRKLWQFLWIWFAGRRATEKAVAQWLAGDREGAYELLEGKRAPSAKVLAHLMRGLQQGQEREPQVREDVERVASDELSRVRSWFRALEAVVQVAPLLGLFGTVIGMIEAFQKLQGAGADVDPALLAGGIWVALLTTAVGLAIAIPSAFVLYWFEALADKEQRYMEAAITSLLTERITDKNNNSVSTASKVLSVTHAA